MFQGSVAGKLYIVMDMWNICVPVMVCKGLENVVLVFGRSWWKSGWSLQGGMRDGELPSPGADP